MTDSPPPVLEDCEWTALRPHVERDALIFVASELDLLEVARRVTSDDAPTVSVWIEHGLLAKPSLAQLERWNRQPQTPFRFVIAQPFVLIQDRAN